MTATPQLAAPTADRTASPAPARIRTVAARLAGWYALSRLVTLAAAMMAVHGVPGQGVSRFLSAWDGGWYLQIVAKGYPAGIPQVAGRAVESTIGFFPLYPLSVRAGSFVLPFSDVVVAIILSMGFGALAVALVYRLACAFTDRRSAERAAILFAFFPGSFVMSMAYTEALMLALSAGCLLALLRRQWLLAGVLAALATATRPTALALVLVCSWQALLAVRQRREWRSLLAPALAPLGAVAYFAYLKLQTGSFTAWFRVEKEAWGQGPKLGPAAFRPVVSFLQAPLSNPRDAVVVLGLVFAVVALGILLWQRWPGVLTAYTLAILAMSANAQLDAFRPRALLTTFPLVIATATVVQGRRFAWLLAVSGVLLFVLTVQYNTGHLGQI